MLTLQSSKSLSVYLLIFKVNQDSLGDVILLVFGSRALHIYEIKSVSRAIKQRIFIHKLGTILSNFGIPVGSQLGDLLVKTSGF